MYCKYCLQLRSYQFKRVDVIDNKQKLFNIFISMNFVIHMKDDQKEEIFDVDGNFHIQFVKELPFYSSSYFLLKLGM